MKVLLPIQFSALLLICVLGKAQQVSARDILKCNATYEYLQESLQKCCSRCPPGLFMKKECDETSDTQCQKCEDGKYTSSWNYAPGCRLCNLCPSPLVMTKNCSRTKKEECDCPKGYTCSQYNGVGVCMFCKSAFSTPVTPPNAEPSITQATPGEVINYPLWVIIIIFALVVVVSIAIVVVVILYVRRNTGILEKLGCMPKAKRPLPETRVEDSEEVNSVPATQTLIPQMDPCYPIQESDPQQSAEYVLNSPHRSQRPPLHM